MLAMGLLGKNRTKGGIAMKNKPIPKHNAPFKDDLTLWETYFLIAISLAWMWIVVEIFRLIF